MLAQPMENPGVGASATSRSVYRGHIWRGIGRVLPPVVILALCIAAMSTKGIARGSAADDEKAVSLLDTQFQAAVKVNDAATMDRILADDFVLVVGTGRTQNKADQLAEARSQRFHYEHQEDTEQRVRIWGDTAVVTAKLWAQGTDNGKPFDYTLWFSDTYVRTPQGWRYVFGQASLPLSAAAH